MSRNPDNLDFDALRDERNARFEEQTRALCAEFGWSMGEIRTTFDPDACYCACSSGGPCEHTWDGKPYEGNGVWSATCSRCGTTSMSHSLRTMD